MTRGILIDVWQCFCDDERGAVDGEIGMVLGALAVTLYLVGYFSSEIAKGVASSLDGMIESAYRRF